jgi:hypothetical protein
VLPVSDETLRPAAQWSVLQCDDAHPAHGPPKRAYCFRGPPRLV